MSLPLTSVCFSLSFLVCNARNENVIKQTHKGFAFEAFVYEYFAYFVHEMLLSCNTGTAEVGRESLCGCMESSQVCGKNAELILVGTLSFNEVCSWHYNRPRATKVCVF